ncbi:FHA domain-containing protein [Agromyces protaetiae]|uniref:FHA domain-containing protein n=1 Tax=Agromyces protaetiae TaxID=2509455 RepID=A0A4P6FAY6_9MICO|nr:FHA domain-containing protein [Agromyces protaetiae]QAY72133.1 FHA domain-containing protein [Agromyces protaetiae]
MSATVGGRGEAERPGEPVRYSRSVFEYVAAAEGIQPGFAIVTGRFVTLFGHETGAEFAGELYAMLENDEAELADVLDLLALEGGPPDCGIVEVVDAETRSVHVGVRGAVDVVMDGVASSRFSGPGGGAWVVGEAAGIEGLRLTIGSVPGMGDRLPVQRGVVRAAEIAMAKVRKDAPRQVLDLATRPIQIPLDAAAIAAYKADAAAKTLPFVAEPVAQPEFDPEHVVEPVPVLSPSVIAEAMGGVSGHAPASPRAAGGTSTGLDQRLQREASEASVASAHANWVLRLPDGLEVAPPVVFGRRPSGSLGDGAVQIVTSSPRREISGRHVEIVADLEGISAVDLGSTNGTVIRPPGRAPYLLIHNAQVALEAGTILDLGESYLVTIGVSESAPA